MVSSLVSKVDRLECAYTVYPILPAILNQSRIIQEHLGSTWRKYAYFGLNLGGNGARLQLYKKTLEIWFTDRGDGVTDSCDDVRAYKGLQEFEIESVGENKVSEDLEEEFEKEFEEELEEEEMDDLEYFDTFPTREELEYYGRKVHLLEDKQILSVGVFDEHLGSTWRKYAYFGLNLGGNGARLKLYYKTLEIWFTDRGDGVTESCDDVRAYKGRCQD
ncbi:hypothetical protein Tco_0796022 [Tanacetum coccineum]